MAEFKNYSTVSITGTVLHVGTTGLALSKTLSLRFYNPAAYVLKLELFTYLTGITSTIYEVTLAAGDTFTDDIGYALAANDQLIATSDIAGTTYYVYGFDS